MPDPTDELAELIDLDYGDFNEDLPFYESLARRCDGPILELGVGTGRAAIPLVRAGFEVWGIDTSETMLARARCKVGAEQAEKLHLLLGDMRDFNLGRTFELVFAGLGTFHHLLAEDDQLACLRSVRKHLSPGGIFVCDQRPWWHTDWEEGTSVPLLHDWTRTLGSTGETVMKFRSVQTDRAGQVQHEIHMYDRVSADGTVRRRTTMVDLRFTSRYEMEGLLRVAGLEMEQLYGDFDLTPFDGDSEYMITVARLSGEETS